MKLSALLAVAVFSVLAPVPATWAAEPPKAGAADAIQDLKIGDAAPDFSLLGIDDQKHTLAEYKDAKVLIVAFISNHCPDSHAAEGRILKLLSDTKGQGVQLVAINPNNPDGLSIDELGYSKYNDGFDDMKAYAKDSGFTFPYLYDGETQAVAKAYGCLATPHIFIFDAQRKLRYKGQFDDSRFADPATVKSHDAANAVKAILAGEPVPVEITKPHGCSTKWITKHGGIAEKMAKWDKTPVDLEQIDATGVAALRKNGSPNVRLFNVWSTTCAPCVAEFPELVQSARKFDLRNFQFVTLSTDDPADQAKAKAFLEKKGAGPSGRAKSLTKADGRTTNHYLYNGASVNDLMKALDPEWPGGFPHTVLVGTSGQVLWRHNGPVSGEELRAKILEHMGAYYQP